MKKAIISGASRGIGKALKEGFENAGWQVLGTTTSSNHETLCALDLSDSASIAAFKEHVLGEFGTIDLLVNNAGILLEDWSTPDINLEELKKTLSVNLVGTVELTESLVPFMNPNGHIINISSTWGSFSNPKFSDLQPHYKISKAALNMYTKVLAHRLGDTSLKVSAVDPGWVKTDMGGTNGLRHPHEVFDDIHWLVTNPDVTTGHFWREKRMREW